jgi:phosphatidylglycerophosphate synthase
MWRAGKEEATAPARLWYGAGMQLHYHSGRPDWEAVPPAKRSFWQRRAAASHGYVTPGNVVSVAGFGLVMLGLVLICRQQLVTGLACIVAGRLGDILDGIVASRTGTKGPMGEAVDAGFDKFGALGVLIVFGLQHIAPWWVIGLVAVQNAISGGLGILSRHKHISAHPVKSGKLATAGE